MSELSDVTFVRVDVRMWIVVALEAAGLQALPLDRCALVARSALDRAPPPPAAERRDAACVWSDERRHERVLGEKQ